MTLLLDQKLKEGKSGEGLFFELALDPYHQRLAYRVSVDSVSCSKSATFGSTAGSPLASAGVI